jgi:hypothetical protein
MLENINTKLCSVTRRLTNNMKDIPSTNRNETPGAGVVQKDDIEFEPANPNIARAIPHANTDIDHPTVTPDEDVAGDTYTGTYPDVVVGSDSATTGTDWGLPAVEGGEIVYTPEGWKPEGDEEGEARPTRNTPGNDYLK